MHLKINASIKIHIVQSYLKMVLIKYNKQIKYTHTKLSNKIFCKPMFRNEHLINISWLTLNVRL